MTRLTIMRLAVLALPVAVLGWQVFALERGLADHTLWRIPIEGFDPRDPIRGQYVLYSYRWPVTPAERSTCEDALAECRLCLTEEAGGVVGAEPVIGDDPAPECTALVTARQPGADNTVFSPQRHYLDERHARAFEQALTAAGVEDRQVEMEVAVTRDGRAHARRLFLDGEPYPAAEDQGR